MTPVFFPSPAAFRDWLDAHHQTAREVAVGFHKRHTGAPSMTWSESVDEALCVGWIDGVRRRIDEDHYMIRFTPRRPTSIWSAINIRKMAALRRQERVRPAGLAAFAKRRAHTSGIYGYERQDRAAFDAAAQSRFTANQAAWAYFQARPPWYRRTCTHWVMSAKKPETRARRLAELITRSAEGRPIGPLQRR